jgi:hypothetical protein
MPYILVPVEPGVNKVSTVQVISSGVLFEATGSVLLLLQPVNNIKPQRAINICLNMFLMFSNNLVCIVFTLPPQNYLLKEHMVFMLHKFLFINYFFVPRMLHKEEAQRYFYSLKRGPAPAVRAYRQKNFTMNIRAFLNTESIAIYLCNYVLNIRKKKIYICKQIFK